MKRTLLAMALLLTSVFGVTGCGSDDDVPPAESRIKNSTGYNDDIHSDLRNPILDLRGEGLDINDPFDDPFDDDGIYTPRMDYDDKLDLMRHHITEEGTRGRLLPGDSDSTWAQVNPGEKGQIEDKNLLNAGHHIGVDTTGSSLRDANRQIRSEPPNPQHDVSPWLQSTISPDSLRRPLDPLDAD